MNYSVKDVTIIITCYKEGELLRRAMDSVQAQTLKGFAVILVNDCSPDALTNAICEEISAMEGLTYVRHEVNGGLSTARNTGFTNMANTIAMPLDADDTLPVNAVEETLRTFNEHPDADMVFGGYAIIDPDTGLHKTETCKSLADEHGRLNPVALAHSWILMGQSPCKRTLWESIDGYSSKFTNTVQDVDFWRRAFLHGAVGYSTGTTIYNWYRVATGMNASVREEDYLLLRIDSLPFYDQFNPAYGKEMRQYIQRYFASRLMADELNTFLAAENAHFGTIDQLKAKLMHIRPLYILLRLLKNRILKA